MAANLLTPTTPPAGGWSTSLSLREKEVKNSSNPLSAAGEERVVERSNDLVSKYTSDINANARPEIAITLSVIVRKLFR